jgi:hypothetical protein
MKNAVMAGYFGTKKHPAIMTAYSHTAINAPARGKKTRLWEKFVASFPGIEIMVSVRNAVTIGLIIICLPRLRC